MIENTTLNDIIELISISKMLITIDSGPRHIAVACGTSVITLRNGANSSIQWGKYYENDYLIVKNAECSPCGKVNCPDDNRICMNNIEPVEVYEEFAKVYSYKPTTEQESVSGLTYLTCWFSIIVIGVKNANRFKNVLNFQQNAKKHIRVWLRGGNRFYGCWNYWRKFNYRLIYDSVDLVIKNS